MARSVAAAITDIEGSELDLILGLSKPPHPAAPTPEPMRAAFEGFDYRHIRRIISWLTSLYHCPRPDAEDATHDAFEYLMAKRPDLFSHKRDRWLRYLGGVSRFRLLQIRCDPKILSLEAMTEVGDAALAEARPIESEAMAAVEDARGIAPPAAAGEEWAKRQIIGALQRFGDHYKRPPKARECLRIHGLPRYATLCKHFGSLTNALRQLECPRRLEADAENGGRQGKRQTSALPSGGGTAIGPSGSICSGIPTFRAGP